MKNYYIVIAVFAGFVVLAVGILALGVRRKGAVGDQLRRRLAEADRILDGSLRDFVAQKPAERKAGLKQARQLRGLLEADPKAPVQKVGDLGDWITDRVALQAAIDDKRRELAGLDRALRNDFLRDTKATQAATAGRPCPQLSRGVAQRIRSAAQRAKEGSSDLTVALRGKRIDLSPVIGTDVQGLQFAADRVVKELQLREKAFTLFVEGMEQALAGRRVDAVRDRAGDLDEWFSCVVDAGEKQRRLKELEVKLAYVRRRGEMEGILHARMDDLARVLANAKSPGEVRTALGQSQEVVTDAQALVTFFPDSTVKAKIPVLAKAGYQAERWLRDRTNAAKVPKGAQDVIDDKILYKMAALIDPQGRPKDVAEWDKAAGPIREAIEHVKAVDGRSAFLTGLLDATRPGPEPPVSPATARVQWIGPDWTALDANIASMKAMSIELARRRKGTAGRWPVQSKEEASAARQSASAEKALLTYIARFAYLKKMHAARLASLQAQEDAKSK